jgi:hypothetical protein
MDAKMLGSSFQGLGIGLTLINSFTEEADVVSERKSTAFESGGSYGSVVLDVLLH